MVGMFTNTFQEEGGYKLLGLLLEVLLGVHSSGARSHFTASVHCAIAFPMASS
jgi:hypothetical protein